jgi:rare lipoprotein A
MLSFRVVIAAFFLSFIAGCSAVSHHPPILKDGPPSERIDAGSIKNIEAKFEPYSKYGNPPFYIVHNKQYFTKTSAVGYVEQGIASWYGSKFHAQRTSSGEPFDMYALSAAHKTLPLPTYAKVTNLENNLSVIVKINDRGPFHDERILDLSYAAALKLGFSDKGTARINLETITFPQHTDPARQNAFNTNESRHYIQVGAFKNRQSAENLQIRLKALHASAKITNDTHQQTSFYRVRLGPFTSRDEATQLALAVDSIGFKPFIITE